MPALFATIDDVDPRAACRTSAFAGLEGIVVVGARIDGHREPVISYGPHVMSMTQVRSLPLERRVAELLAAEKLSVAGHPVASNIHLPKSLVDHSVPVVVVMVDCALGPAALAGTGAALRRLRSEGVILAGLGRAPGSMDAVAALSVIMAAADRNDSVIELDPRREGAGFLLVPASYDGADDAGCCFWTEAAGEMPQLMKRQKPGSSIQITRFDKKRLLKLLRTLDASAEPREEIDELERELSRGIEVDSVEVGPDVVTMNSTVKVTDLDSGSSHVYTIVFPPDADHEKGRISILSPLGTALLGYRVGETVSWQMPGPVRRLRIDALIYQPEAAGDYHL